jgi:diphthine-ammonia ligase
LTKDVMQVFKKNGVDPFGEKGEFHTFVTYCPLYASEIKMENDFIYRELNYQFLRIKAS